METCCDSIIENQIGKNTKLGCTDAKMKQTGLSVTAEFGLGKPNTY